MTVASRQAGGEGTQALSRALSSSGMTQAPKKNSPRIGKDLPRADAAEPARGGGPPYLAEKAGRSRQNPRGVDRFGYGVALQLVEPRPGPAQAVARHLLEDEGHQVRLPGRDLGREALRQDLQLGHVAALQGLPERRDRPIVACHAVARTPGSFPG